MGVGFSVCRAGADIDRFIAAECSQCSHPYWSGENFQSRMEAFRQSRKRKEKEMRGGGGGERGVDRLFHLNFLTLSDFWFMARPFPCTLLNSVDIQYLKGSQFFPEEALSNLKNKNKLTFSYRSLSCTSTLGTLS